VAQAVRVPAKQEERKKKKMVGQKFFLFFQTSVTEYERENKLT
jgi:hypothetical protein